MTGNGLCIGDEAPDFTLRDQFGQDVRLGDFRGRKAVVLMFFPLVFRDRAKRCTTCGHTWNKDGPLSPTVVGDKAWRDTHVRLVGDAVSALALIFLEDWTFASGRTPVGPAYLRPAKGEGRVLAQIVSSGPDLDASFAIYGQFFAARVVLRSRRTVEDHGAAFC